MPVKICTIERDELLRALALLPDLLAGDSVEIAYAQPLPGFVAVSVGDSVIPAATLLSKHREFAWTVPLSLLRDAAEHAKDDTLIVSDDSGVLVLGSARVTDESDEDTKPTPAIKAREPGKGAPTATPDVRTESSWLPLDLPKLAPTTPTFRLLRAALALSAAESGVPNVERIAGGYAIRVNECLAYGVGITEPKATIVSLHARVNGTWHILRRDRMPKLQPAELLNLFVVEEQP